MAKMPSKARKVFEQTARVVGLLAALVTYCLIPLNGRTPIGLAALAAGLLGYVAVRLAIGWTFGRLTRKAAR